MEKKTSNTIKKKAPDETSLSELKHVRTKSISTPEEDRSRSVSDSASSFLCDIGHIIKPIVSVTNYNDFSNLKHHQFIISQLWRSDAPKYVSRAVFLLEVVQKKPHLLDFSSF